MEESRRIDTASQNPELVNQLLRLAEGKEAYGGLGQLARLACETMDSLTEQEIQRGRTKTGKGEQVLMELRVGDLFEEHINDIQQASPTVQAGLLVHCGEDSAASLKVIGGLQRQVAPGVLTEQDRVTQAVELLVLLSPVVTPMVFQKTSALLLHILTDPAKLV